MPVMHCLSCRPQPHALPTPHRVAGAGQGPLSKAQGFTAASQEEVDDPEGKPLPLHVGYRECWGSLSALRAPCP